MLIKKIRIENINSYKTLQEMEFPSGVIGIIGRNGSGKTTLVESIMGTLYGRMPFRRGVVSNRLSKGRENGEMEIEFEHKGTSYRAVRKITFSTQKAFLYLYSKEEKKWHSLVSKGAVKPFEKKIAEMFGSYETVLSSVFCSQNNANDLLSVEPTERKDKARDLVPSI